MSGDTGSSVARALEPALSAWRRAIGPSWVLTGGEALERAQQATFATAARSLAMLSPADAGEVAACLRIASRHRIPVYPFSGGRNWGYGSRVPPRDGAVLLSLARLDRILAHDEELAYVTLEPGVTFAALEAFLGTRASRLLPPLTGASPDASIIGNVLERGLGKGPYEDMAGRTADYEVVLASGATLRTGYGDAAPRVAPLRADGIGPGLRGLFLQGNLGVVTRLTLWLDLAPAWRQQLRFEVGGQPAALVRVLDALRDPLLRGHGRIQAELINDYRLLANCAHFPFDRAPEGEVLGRPLVASGLAALGLSTAARWFGCATLWADDEAELAWRRAALLAALAVAEITAVAAPPVPGLASAKSGARVASPYWRKRQAPDPADRDPDRDRCGLIWLAPVLPMVGAEAVPVLAAIEETMRAAGFEPGIALRLVGGRSLLAVVGLLYDRDAPGADDRAAACHAALRRLLDARGLPPYRLGWLDLADATNPVPHQDVLRRLKHVLDPAGILAPGRYIADAAGGPCGPP